MKAKFERIEMSEDEISQALAQAKAVLPATTFERIENIVLAYSTLVKVLEDIPSSRIETLLCC